jgi:hypothetical protein
MPNYPQQSCLPFGSLPLPFLAEAASGAPWPVWRDSTRGEVKFRPKPSFSTP